MFTTFNAEQMARLQRVKLKNLEHRDSWAVIIDDIETLGCLNEREATWRKEHFIETGNCA